MIPVREYEVQRIIPFDDISRQRFRKLCRTLQTTLPDYYRGALINGRQIIIGVAKHTPVSNDYIAEAKKRNALLADEITTKLKEIVANEKHRNL